MALLSFYVVVIQYFNSYFGVFAHCILPISAGAFQCADYPIYVGQVLRSDCSDR